MRCHLGHEDCCFYLKLSLSLILLLVHYSQGSQLSCCELLCEEELTTPANSQQGPEACQEPREFSWEQMCPELSPRVLPCERPWAGILTAAF